MLTLAAFTLALGLFHLAVSAPIVELQLQFVSSPRFFSIRNPLLTDSRN